MTRARRFLLPALLYAAVTVQSSFGAPASPFRFHGGDKVAHFLGYGVIGLALARAFGRARATPPRALSVIVWTACVIAGLGALDELHQAFVPGRSPDVLDALADLAGGAVGALCWVLWARLAGGPHGDAVQR